ncbi:acyl-CoA thioester hydrolase [Sinorhizobium fredii]|uniref:3-hydroxybutyryl-CoA dehydrogenase n=1 Tax=Sinorhizobium fredii (strain USDA 257) TaxID=1185652 RepID=I3X374_SINF2|nr:thioesterase family protein [Sinorhizobium fredii]AFL50330.1 3-hydroxybutyryl-CoA dehydrogenase [Sinorhizobium fredii USDA 257]
MPSPTFTTTAVDERPQENALLTLEATVDHQWIDYNGHMTEWQYYKVLADAGENFLRAMGFTEDYRLKGFSFFSVEGHLRNLRECRTGTPLRVFTEMIGYDDVRLHIYQYVVDAAKDVVLATGEHLMLHVDTARRRAAPIDHYMRECLSRALERWKPHQAPKGLGAATRRVSA